MNLLSLPIIPKASRFSPGANSEVASPIWTAPTVFPSSRSVCPSGAGKSEADTSEAALMRALERRVAAGRVPGRLRVVVAAGRDHESTDAHEGEQEPAHGGAQ